MIDPERLALILSEKDAENLRLKTKFNVLEDHLLLKIAALESNIEATEKALLMAHDCVATAKPIDDVDDKYIAATFEAIVQALQKLRATK